MNNINNKIETCVCLVATKIILHCIADDLTLRTWLIIYLGLDRRRVRSHRRRFGHRRRRGHRRRVGLRVLRLGRRYRLLLRRVWLRVIRLGRRYRLLHRRLLAHLARTAQRRISWRLDNGRVLFADEMILGRVAQIEVHTVGHVAVSVDVRDTPCFSIKAVIVRFNHPRQVSLVDAILAIDPLERRRTWFGVLGARAQPRVPHELRVIANGIPFVDTVWHPQGRPHVSAELLRLVPCEGAFAFEEVARFAVHKIAVLTRGHHGCSRRDCVLLRIHCCRHRVQRSEQRRDENNSRADVHDGCRLGQAQVKSRGVSVATE